MSRTFSSEKNEILPNDHKFFAVVWGNDFQAFLVDFISENFGGSRSATVLPDTLKPILMYS